MKLNTNPLKDIYPISVRLAGLSGILGLVFIFLVFPRFVSESEAIQIVEAFMAAKFEGGRHARRVGKIACCVFAILLGIGSAFAQDTEAIEPLSPATYSEMLDTNNLRGHLSIIASDGFEGRETGTRGADLTAAYLESYYLSLGFSPYDGKSFTQQVPMIAAMK